MKKVTLIIAAAFVMLFASNAQAQLGFNFGYAPQTTTVSMKSTSSHSDMTGLFAGVNYNMALSSGLGLSMGVDGRYNFSSSTTTLATVKETQMLIDVPILLNIGLTLAEKMTLTLFAGPTISYALKGNTATDVLNTDNIINVDWYGENSNNKQLDILATAGVSLRFTDLRFFGGYRLGLLDLDARDNVKTNTSGLFFGVGYVLN